MRNNGKLIAIHAVQQKQFNISHLLASKSVCPCYPRMSHSSSHHSGQSERDDLGVFGPLFRDFKTVSEVDMHHSARHSFEHQVGRMSVA